MPIRSLAFFLIIGGASSAALAQEFQISGPFSNVGGAQGFSPFGGANFGDPFVIDLGANPTSLTGSVQNGRPQLSETITNTQLFVNGNSIAGSFGTTGH